MTYYIIRGGSWNYFKIFCCAVNRSNGLTPDYCCPDAGFRLIKRLKP